MAIGETEKWLQKAFGMVLIALVTAGVLGLFAMKDNTSTSLSIIEKEISLYAVQLANTERSMRTSLTAHANLDAHKDAGGRIRAMELRLASIDARLIAIQTQLRELTGKPTR